MDLKKELVEYVNKLKGTQEKKNEPKIDDKIEEKMIMIDKKERSRANYYNYNTSNKFFLYGF